MGAQKAGTSWWYWLIEKHPQVVKRWVKELHFFDTLDADILARDELERYRSHFPRPRGRLSGEWSPGYTFYPRALPLLSQAAPDARVLLLVRDPVERFRAGLTAMYYWHGGRPPDDAEELAFTRGLYARQLGRVYEHFPRAQVLVLQYEKCAASPQSEIARTYRFLGVDDSFIPSNLHRPINVSHSKLPLSAQRRAQLTDAYQADVKRLCEMVRDLDMALWPNFRHLAM